MGSLSLVLLTSLSAQKNRLILKEDNFVLSVNPKGITEFQFPDSVKRVVTSNDSISAQIIDSHAFVNFPDFRGWTKIFILYGRDKSVAIRCISKNGSPDKYEFIPPPTPLMPEKAYMKPPPSDFIRLFRGMYLGTKVSGFRVEEFGLSKKFPLSDSLKKLIKARIFRVYYSRRAYGYVIQIRARKDVKLKEKDFYFVGLKGIYLQKYQMKKGETAIVLIVSNRPVLKEITDESASINQ